MRFITFGSLRPLVIATAGYFSGRFKIDVDWYSDFLSFLRWDVIYDSSLGFQAASSNEDNDDTTRTYRGAMIVIDSSNKGGSFG